MIVETGSRFLAGSLGSARVYPEPATPEEARLWQYVAGYMHESARLDAPVEIPYDLREALGIGSMLMTPVFGAGEVAAIVAVMGKPSSPPLKAEERMVLDQLAEGIFSEVRGRDGLGRLPAGPERLSRALRASGVVRSIRELCATLGTLSDLVVKMSLAQTALIRLLNRDTGELELVATSGREAHGAARAAVPASLCPALGSVGEGFRAGGAGGYQCPAAQSHPAAEALCVPLVAGPGAAGVLELWSPPAGGLSETDTRLVRAIASTAERAIVDARMHAAQGWSPAQEAFLRGISVTTATCSEPKHVARQILSGLRASVAFDLGAFAEKAGDLEGPGVSLVACVASSASQPTSEQAAPTCEPRLATGDRGLARTREAVSIAWGDSEAEAWANQALREAGGVGHRLCTRSLYLPGTKWPAGLLIPLVFHDDAVGVLVLGRARGERFSLDEIGFLDGVRRDLAALWEHFKYQARQQRRPVEETMAERIAALEQLAASTAHEIKNPLSVIKGYLQVIQSDPSTSEGTKKRIGRLSHQLDQINNVAEDLAQLAKPVPSDLSAVSLTGMVEEVLEIMEPQASAMGINIVRSYAEDTPEIVADSGKLQQVFLNLCRNSIEAMTPQGGELRISTRISADRRAAEVEFRDTGPGMTSEVMSQIFHPFFTTKKHGAGLGLSISMHIVKQHGGTIRVESSPGAGAAFTVALPLSYALT